MNGRAIFEVNVGTMSERIYDSNKANSEYKNMRGNKETYVACFNGLWVFPEITSLSIGSFFVSETFPHV